MMKSLLILTLFSAASAWGQMTPQTALQNLKEGNARFAIDQSIHPDRTSERRLETAASQEPFAVIVGCSDSRVAPEILFDQGIGDLFIVRVAGNVVGPLELGSIEYSSVFLHSSLIVVLGHENCGAVKAVMGDPPKEIEAIAMLIAPALEQAKGAPGNPLENAIKANVKDVVHQLKGCPTLKKLIFSKKLNIVGGYYNFHTGKVEFITD